LGNHLVIKGNIREALLKTWSSERKLTRLLKLLLVATGILLVAFFTIYYYNHFIFLGNNPSFEQSLNTLKQHVLADPGDPTARIQLAAMYFEHGEYAQAIEQGESVLASNPEYQDALYLVGLAHIQAGSPQEGIPMLARFADHRRDSAMWRTDLQLEEALYYLGAAYIQVDQLELARQALGLALEIDRTDADAIFLLGQVYAGLGQVEAAAEQYLAALRYVPDFEDVYLALFHLDSVSGHRGRLAYAEAGLAYCHQDYEIAIEKLDLTLKADPQFVAAYVLLGLAHEGQGELELARQNLEKALVIEPENFLAQHVLGRIAAGRGTEAGSEP
jgi:tetratricopeptide (TPR) repeat protein